MRSSRPSLANVGNSSNQRPSMGPGRASLAASKLPGRSSVAPGDDPRRSRGMSLSGNYMGRRSSVAPGRDNKPKDPRQITDKDFKQSSIRKLIKYLAEHGYDRTISPSLLTSPSGKDFLHIISFALKRAIPNFDFSGKFEEELPTVMKTLGYPYPISKGNLTSVGAPHAWPTILAAVAWLVDLLNYSEATEEGREGGEGFDNDDGNKMFFDYLSRGYALFLAGEDDLSALEDEIAFTFETKNKSLEGDIASLSTANEELSKQLASLTEGETPLQRAQSHARDLKSDTAKFEKHIADLHEHRTKVSTRMASHTQENDEKQAALAALLTEITAHKGTVAAQELTPTDVQRMQSERSHLEGELGQLKAQKDALSKQLWEDELAISRSIDRLESKVTQANNCSLRLHLMPPSAKHARGASLELGLRKAALATDAPEGVLCCDGGASTSAAELQAALHRLKAEAGSEVSGTQDELLTAEEEGVRREDESMGRAEEIAALKSTLAKLERDEKRLREEHAKALADQKAATEELEERLLRARSSSGQSVAASAAELSTLQKEHTEFLETGAMTRERMINQLVSSLDMLMLHKETLEGSLLSLKKHVGEKMESLAPLLDSDGTVDLA